MSNSERILRARSPLLQQLFSRCSRPSHCSCPSYVFLNFPLQSVSHPVQHHCLAPLLKFPAHTYPLVLTKPSLSSDEVIFSPLSCTSLHSRSDRWSRRKEDEEASRSWDEINMQRDGCANHFNLIFPLFWRWIKTAYTQFQEEHLIESRTAAQKTALHVISSDQVASAAEDAACKQAPESHPPCTDGHWTHPSRFINAIFSAHLGLIRQICSK